MRNESKKMEGKGYEANVKLTEERININQNKS
jgi:hypothetical protein